MVPDIVPETTSAVCGSPAESFGLEIFKCTVPLPGNPVELAKLKDEPPASNCALNVVDTPELAPLIVTLLLVVCIPWSGCIIFTVVDVFKVSIGFSCKVCDGTGSLCNSILPEDVVVNLARYKLNFIS